jgi:hypothetical protein
MVLLFMNAGLSSVKPMPRRFFETPAESVQILPDGRTAEGFHNFPEDFQAFSDNQQRTLSVSGAYK